MLQAFQRSRILIQLHATLGCTTNRKFVAQSFIKPTYTEQDKNNKKAVYTVIYTYQYTCIHPGNNSVVQYKKDYTKVSSCQAICLDKRHSVFADMESNSTGTFNFIATFNGTCEVLKSCCAFMYRKGFAFKWEPSMDAKWSLVVEMLHYHFVFKRYTEEQEKR